LSVECTGERIIKIGKYLAKMGKSSTALFMDHAVVLFRTVQNVFFRPSLITSFVQNFIKNFNFRLHLV